MLAKSEINHFQPVKNLNLKPIYFSRIESESHIHFSESIHMRNVIPRLPACIVMHTQIMSSISLGKPLALCIICHCPCVPAYYG
jgi:hypothetical protein